MSCSLHPAHVPARGVHPRARARVAISIVSKTSRSSRCFVMTSMSPSARYASIIPVNIARNSVYGVPPCPSDNDGVAFVVVSTSRVNSRGKEMPRPRPRAALAETSEENVVCTSERSVAKARNIGASSRSVSTSSFRERDSLSEAQQAETACTVLICVCNNWNHKSSTDGTSSTAGVCPCACLLERSTQMATPVRPIASRLSTCCCSCCSDPAGTPRATISPTTADKRLPNVATLLSAALGLPRQSSPHTTASNIPSSSHVCSASSHSQKSAGTYLRDGMTLAGPTLHNTAT